MYNLKKFGGNMKRVIILFRIIAFAPFVLSLCNIHSQDWNQWRGTARNGVVTGFTPP